MITVYHNPRCGKSRECLAFIENSEMKFEVIKYLETPFTKIELLDVIKKLKIKPIDLIRLKEKIWIEIYKNKKLTDDEIINAMIKFPILIERPFDRVKEII